MRAKNWATALCAAVMAILILDGKSALSAGADGITMCLQTVIPSLFPFLLLSILLTDFLRGGSFPSCNRLSQWMGIPPETIPLYCIGLIGGYPAGAQSIALCCGKGTLDRRNAGRMVAFCNNAGPAFLFGIGAVVFDSLIPCILLWGIQILSSLFLAFSMPGQIVSSGKMQKEDTISISRTMRLATQTMGLICGWVVLFRVILAFLQRWFLWLLPLWGRILVTGMLEMTNGCCQLSEISSVGEKILLFALFGNFGGLCVTLQTLSITAEVKIPMRSYLPAKLAQAGYALILSQMAQWLLPAKDRFFLPLPIPLLCIVGLLCFAFLGRKRKKGVAIPSKLLYNEKKSPLLR